MPYVCNNIHNYGVRTCIGSGGATGPVGPVLTGPL